MGDTPVTPTTFSSKGNHVPSLSPATIATSLQQRWWAWNRRLAPPRIDRNAMASVSDDPGFHALIDGVVGHAPQARAA